MCHKHKRKGSQEEWFEGEIRNYYLLPISATQLAMSITGPCPNHVESAAPRDASQHQLPLVPWSADVAHPAYLLQETL